MPDLTIELTKDPIPTDLLLLSDPSKEVIDEYLGSSIQFIAKLNTEIVGVEPDYFRKNHTEKIYENGIECRDMIRMRMEL